MNFLTMTEKELIEHASKQVQALRMALDMIECEKYERRHVRWAIINALKEEVAAQSAVPDAFGTREGKHPQYIQGWNDCRAEMLREFKEKEA